MNLLIVGMGTIGDPLARLFCQTKKELGIDEVIIHKNSPNQEDRGTLARFHYIHGAKLAVYKGKRAEFEKLLLPVGFAPDYSFDEALDRAHVVIDCTKEKMGRKLKEEWYKNFESNTLGFIAQGSEKGFGAPFAFGINDESLKLGTKYVQVVSCNTHQVLCLLKTLVLDYGGSENLASARFDICRRASDISQDESIVGVEVGSGPEKPPHSIYGSHQGEDAARVLETIGVRNLDLHSTVTKINNSYSHVVNFRVVLKEKIDCVEVERRFRANPLIAVTYKSSNNRVFSVGRDEGHSGRILNQTVVALRTIEVIRDGHEVVGYCFTPQDGNSLLSSVAATLWLKDPTTYKKKMSEHFSRVPYNFQEREV